MLDELAKTHHPAQSQAVSRRRVGRNSSWQIRGGVFEYQNYSRETCRQELDLFSILFNFLTAFRTW